MLDCEVSAAVASLLPDAVDFPDARLILADVLERRSTTLAMRLRLACYVPLLWEAARFGTAAARRAAADGRAAVQWWAETVRADRLFPSPYLGPETGICPLTGRTVFTLRECEGSLRYRRQTETSMRIAWRLLTSTSHVLRLCLRALNGCDVPPDVQYDAAGVAEVCRDHIRNLGSVLLTKEGV